MKSAPIFPLLAGLLALALVSETAVPQSALEGRVGRLERILENQSGSDLLLQVQRLQVEMQELRGMLETQRFQIEKLQRQLRDQYLDIDSRLGSSQRAGAVGQFGGPATAAGGGAQGALPAGVIDASGLDQSSGDVTRPQYSAAPPASIGGGVVGVPSLPSPETVGGSERDAYSEAFGLLKERKYEDATEAFNELLSRYPRGEFSDNARYWLGETYYVQRDYPAALAQFEALVRNNPASPKVPGAMLKIGYIQYDQEAYDQARASLERVIERYPSSTEARLARSRLERIADPMQAR